LGAHYPLTVLDLDTAKVTAATDQGATAAQTPGEVAEHSDIIILALPGSPAVDAVMQGETGILSHLRAGQLVIDTGTTRPATDKLYAKLCAEKGAGLIDAPLTWRKAGQIIMVGGTVEDYARAEEVLKILSYKLKHIGPIGSGQALKAINQCMQAGRLAVNAECFEFAKMQGLDPHLIKDYLEYDIPDAFFTDEFVGGGHLLLHYKDLLYAMEIAHDSGAQIPITSLIHEIFKTTAISGDPRWFQLGIIHYWRRLNQKR
jgi:3-hydroxyisobutyrate dehydrogenase-like beta-hydroxyacid dehydrogenase